MEGICYICKYPSARGDQCDNCGNLMEAIQLIEPHSRSNPADKLIKRDSEHYFLDLGKSPNRSWSTWQRMSITGARMSAASARTS